MYTCVEEKVIKEEEKQKDSETIKELMAAIKRRDEHVEALIRVNEKHADNFAELEANEKRMPQRTMSAGCADASGFSDK